MQARARISALEQEISELREAARGREAASMLREVQEIGRLGRWEYDLGTRELAWSDFIYTLFELDSDTFPASYEAFLEFVHPEDRARVDAAYRDSIAEHRPYTILHRIVMRDGRLKWVKEVGRTEYGEDGAPLRSFGIVQDVTEQKLIEEELRERNEFIQTILDNLPIGLAVNRIGDGRASYVNRKFSEIYGWPRESIHDVETFFRTVYPDPEYRQQVQERVMRDIASGDPAAMNWRGMVATGQDGSERIVNAGNIPLIEQGLMISTVRDVTAQVRQAERIRELEQQYQQAQRLETVGRLAGGIAHDFNNLLTVILSYASTSIHALSPEDPIRADLRQIMTAGERAAALTRQLLAFSRRQVLAPKVIDLNVVILELRRILLRLIGEDIDLQTHLSSGASLVHADPGQIEQVIMNLAVNARDAMPAGGELTIETAHVLVDEDYASIHRGATAGPHVLLAVSDTGEGMDDATRARIFEPFFTTKEQGKGTGLGLASVYGIVKQSGGNIWVYSEPGRGTTFKVYLPRVEAELSARASAPPPFVSVARGTEAVLVVEDEPSVRELTHRILATAGYEVITAGSGAEAVQEYETHGDRIQLVLTDVVMPGMSGRELASRLLQRAPGLKFLYMSGYAAHGIVHGGELDAGTAFIAKPFNAEMLLGKVREILDGV